MTASAATLHLEKWHALPRTLLVGAQRDADHRKHVEVTVIHLVAQLLGSGVIHTTIHGIGMDPEAILADATTALDALPTNANAPACLDHLMLRVLGDAESLARRADAKEVTLEHLVHALAAAGTLLPHTLSTAPIAVERIDMQKEDAAAPSPSRYLLDGRQRLRATITRIERARGPRPNAIGADTLLSVERGLTLIESLPDLAVERTREAQLTIRRVGGSARLILALQGDNIVMRVARGDVEFVHRFAWDATSVRWTSGGQELFEVVSAALENDLYGPESV